MATGTLAAGASIRGDHLDSAWSDAMTKSEAEFLLDRLEAAGFRDVKVRCTTEDLFAVQIPSEEFRSR